jgi:hypothetical protein
MKINMYVIYDVKAKFYNKPFYMQNDSIAIRAFNDLANDPQTDVFKHPTDFILFNIGVYDDETASIEAHDPLVLARAHELKEEAPTVSENVQTTLNQIKENDL